MNMARVYVTSLNVVNLNILSHIRKPVSTTYTILRKLNNQQLTILRKIEKLTLRYIVAAIVHQ